MKERLLSSKTNMVDGYLHAYEIANGEVRVSSGSQSQTFQLKQFTYFKVARLKEVYLAKTRKADEAEDEYVISSLFMFLFYFIASRHLPSLIYSTYRRYTLFVIPH